MDKSMKILVSSKYLASKLKEIKFASDYVQRIILEKDVLSLITNSKKVVDVQVHVCRFHPSIAQHDRQWRDIRNVVCSVEDQPIVLEISENVVSLIFQI